MHLEEKKNQDLYIFKSTKYWSEEQEFLPLLKGLKLLSLCLLQAEETLSSIAINILPLYVVLINNTHLWGPPQEFMKKKSDLKNSSMQP